MGFYPLGSHEDSDCCCKLLRLSVKEAHFSCEMLAGLRAVFRKADVCQPGWLLSDLPSGKYTKRSHSAMLLHAAKMSCGAQT